MKNLTELCYERIARLMKESYWTNWYCTNGRAFRHYPSSVKRRLKNYNPFSYLPTTIVDKLTAYYVKISEPEGFDWRLLLSSGCVRNFALVRRSMDYELPMLDAMVYSENLYNSFYTLSLSSVNLTAIKINQLGWGTRHSITEALDRLLTESPNLRQLESDIRFSFCSLLNCSHLEELIIHFRLEDDNRVSDFLNVNGQFKHHSSLKRLVLEKCWAYNDCYYVNRMNTVDRVADINIVLEYCTELVSFDCDLSQSFRDLHLREMHSGSLAKRYKLQRFFLKCYEYIPVAKEVIQIASVTCPDLRELFLCTNDEGISMLSKFGNIRHLEIRWTPSEDLIDHFEGSYIEEIESWSSLIPGDYTVAVKPILDEPSFGHKIISLHLISFTSMDFSSIGSACPNLEELEVFYEEENNCYPFLPTSFQKLLRLKLRKKRKNVEEDTIVGILSRAVNLEFLQLQKAEKFTDAVLKSILKVNRFSKLKDFDVVRCGLSLRRGIVEIASTVRSLKAFTFCDDLVARFEIEGIFLKYNPNVTINSTTEYENLFMRRMFMDY